MDKLKLSTSEGQKVGFGPYPVLIIEHALIPLPDGINLAAKIFFPRKSAVNTSFEAAKRQWEYFDGYDKYGSVTSQKDEKFPVIMEYIPYRKSDVTAERDQQRHPWFTSHGYVVMRVDMRGAGEYRCYQVRKTFIACP